LITLRYYQFYQQKGKTFRTQKQALDFAVALESRELGYCTAITIGKKTISGKAFRNLVQQAFNKKYDLL